MSTVHNKRLPPSVLLPLMLMIGQPIRQLSAFPRVWAIGSTIHFAKRKKKKKKRVHTREETAKTTGKLYGGAAWWI